MIEEKETENEEKNVNLPLRNHDHSPVIADNRFDSSEGRIKWLQNYACALDKKIELILKILEEKPTAPRMSLKDKMIAEQIALKNIARRRKLGLDSSNKEIVIEKHDV